MRPSAATPNSLCAACGHVARWHDGEYARRERRDPGLIDRPCYYATPPADAACPCRGFEDSGDIAVRRVGGSAYSTWGGGGSITRAALLLFLFVVLGLALLYAYRSQTPAVPSVPVTQAIQEVQAGQVRRVTISGTTATIELTSGQKQRTTVAERDDVLQRAVIDYNTANPTRQIDLRYEETSQTLSVIGSILLSLLPVVLIGALFLYLLSAARRRS
jgi:hypothetical protein